MNNCRNCDNAIFNHIWGEYICGKKRRTCTEVEVKSGCNFWKEKKTDGKTSTMADKS